METMTVKAFFFVLALILPDGSKPPQTQERMPDLVSCLSRVAEVTSELEKIDSQFGVSAGCVMISQKAGAA